jgi:hypothetical protein
LKLSSIELISVHEAADPAEDDPLESEDRSATFEVVLTARFTTALVTALTAFFTALFDELIARKPPLARDTSAKPTARDKTPSPIRHLLREDELTDASCEDGPVATSRERCVSMRYPS